MRTLAELAGSPKRFFQAHAILNAVAQLPRGIPDDLIKEIVPGLTCQVRLSFSIVYRSAAQRI